MLVGLQISSPSAKPYSLRLEQKTLFQSQLSRQRDTPARSEHSLPRQPWYLVEDL